MSEVVRVKVATESLLHSGQFLGQTSTGVAARVRANAELLR